MTNKENNDNKEIDTKDEYVKKSELEATLDAKFLQNLFLYFQNQKDKGSVKNFVKFFSELKLQTDPINFIFQNKSNKSYKKIGTNVLNMLKAKKSLLLI